MIVFVVFRGGNVQEVRRACQWCPPAKARPVVGSVNVYEKVSLSNMVKVFRCRVKTVISIDNTEKAPGSANFMTY